MLFFVCAMFGVFLVELQYFFMYNEKPRLQKNISAVKDPVIRGIFVA